MRRQHEAHVANLMYRIVCVRRLLWPLRRNDFGARRILPVHSSIKDKEHCLWYDVELCVGIAHDLCVGIAQDFDSTVSSPWQVCGVFRISSAVVRSDVDDEI